MPKELTLEEAYDRCIADGMIVPKEDIESGRIRSIIKIAEEDLKNVDDLIKKGERFSTIYKLAYDVLHSLCEAMLLIDKLKSQNHMCLFACVCMKHPELELDWMFFEKVRTKRNGIQYYGSAASRDDWKEVGTQMMLYIRTLMKEIESRLDQ